MNFKNYLLLLLAVMTGCISGLRAQTCGSDLVHHRLLQTNSNYAHLTQQHAARWASYNQTMPNGLITNTANGIVYEIPLVVHVMHANAALGSINNPTDAVIITYIDYLNKTYAAQWPAYADTNNGGVKIPIKFVLAKRAPSASCSGAATTGINRINVSATYSNYAANGINSSPGGAGVDDSVLKSLSIWPNSDYYNIWMVNYIDGPSGGIGGYAYYPGASSSIDGTVILAQYATPTAGSYYYAVPHELGHAFGLPHTFEGSSGTICASNGNCAVDGDGVCDTEPHINLNNGVCASGINPCTGVAYNNVQYNFMNYTACPNRFTAGQRTKALFNLTNYRPGLLYSLGTTLPAVATAPTGACVPVINPANAGNNFDAGPNEIYLTTTTGTTIFGNSSQGYSSDGYKAYIDRTCRMVPAPLTTGTTYNIAVTTFINAQNVRAYIDYNNDGTFAASEQILIHTGTQSDETHTASFVVPSTGVTLNTTLRMRVLADIGTTIQPCMTLAYGQAEDFPITVSTPGIPTITIASVPVSPICAGTSVTFTATITNAPSPTYQWMKNGVNVGTNSSTYTTNTLVNGDVITCSVTTGTTTVTSTGITMVVNPVVAPSVTITPNPAGAVCAGTSVTYTATPTNGGTTPTYQWSLNGVNTVTTSTYTVTPANGNLIGVVLTSNATCAVPASVTNAVTAVVNPILVPAVTITANPGSTICNGTSVTFTATPTNGGTTPAYQWKLNGVNVGTNSNTYTNAALANGNTVTCVLTSNATCATPTTATSNTITMVVNAIVVPSVTIAAVPGNTICAGTSVTFTATPVNGGTTPAYQWKLNGLNVGTNSTTYTNAALANGDIVTCVLTSNATCATPASATSSPITMVVNPILVPSVTITANPGNTICTNTSVTFTATPTNGGATPAYQWKLNGVNVGTNSNTYTNAALANGNIVTCVLTSNATCATPLTATSNAITMSVNATVAPTVTIAAVPGTTICANTSVTFTATPVNGGTTPAYQWKLNGVNVGTNSATYTNAALANGNIVTCVLTSSLVCASPATATSNALTMAVTSSLTPAVAITANPGNTICASTSVTFTAVPTNGGTTPAYQWKLNGVNVGTNSTTYTNAALANGNIVTCVLTSNATCASPTTATSNAITMVVTAPVAPAVTITANPGTTICAGSSVTFTATPVNGGTTPSYQWKLNGVNVGTNSATYTNAALAFGDIVTCVLTSSATCITASTATSNALTMIVNPLVTPSVSIVANPAGAICAGTSVTFTPTPVNGGSSPLYIWLRNGVSVATTSTYTTSTLTNGETISVVMTSNATCTSTSTASSNIITMAVNPIVVPTIIITANPNSTVCAGTLINFTAAITNGGTTPTYQWKVNGLNVGTNASTYSSNTFANNDIVTATLTSSATCPSAVNVTSSAVIVHIAPATSPSVLVTVSPNDTVCAGTLVTFTATPTNGGTNPTYAWRNNGLPVAGSTNTYSSTTLHDSDIITVIITSNAPCPVVTTAFGNITYIHVNDLPNPVITRSGNVLSTGTGYVDYQWSLNGATLTGATSSSVALSGDGDYTVTVTDANGCSNVSAVFSYTASVGVTPVNGHTVSFYPNPAQSTLFIEADEAVNVSIYSMEGKVVLKGINVRKMDISAIADGLYMIQIRDKQNQLLKTAKLTKSTH